MKILIIIILLLTTSCNSKFLLKNRIQNAQEIANLNGLKKSLVTTSYFYITTYSKVRKSSQTLNVYIEGDGLAWKNRTTISKNPTPINPMSLRMAAVDRNPNILYIARPCQYTNLEIDRNCISKFWTGSRFSSEVINSIDEVIRKFSRTHKIKNINLYGYSGGGGVAVLVASKRQNVKSIKTVAANLDHASLTKIHKVSPMKGSLNPIDFARDVKNIPQLHIGGMKDEIIPYETIKLFTKKINKYGGKAKYKIMRNADHNYEGWPQIWDTIVNK